MARPKKAPQLDSNRSRIAFGSPGHESLLSGGYGGMTRATAEQIIAERKKDPHTWPWAEYQKALAFLEALNVKDPQPSSIRPGWERSRAP